jgi:hypothetical protein
MHWLWFNLTPRLIAVCANVMPDTCYPFTDIYPLSIIFCLVKEGFSQYANAVNTLE